MSEPKKYTAKYRQMGEGVWKAVIVGPDGEETTSVMESSAVKARSKVMREFAKDHPDEAEEVTDPGFISDDDLKDWESHRNRWKKRFDELREQQEGEEKLVFLKLMGKYGLSPEQLAPFVGVSAPTIRARTK
jgi:hypothetical protein